MELVSKYVREQKRYAKNELKHLFEFDESGIEKFLKTLKSYGIIKYSLQGTTQSRYLTGGVPPVRFSM